ncbi:hypothetical protein CXG81DRAFT_27497 [Caulochytrium protostelioides]|uniref:LIM zinc-binding domain-containing protein n=1 Tax=Caulochytrium protostelioides TaxID=1555241 RepID=A0A4P9X3X7_9FUNG|nr:hypothetical protein CXG81DRAFT_27497 [Caulochytrium protostelioides]|eukprot:RKO99759.1 hypothetical protein CXG81DRAFT_27497 [Caulochytrium protostelioides]
MKLKAFMKATNKAFSDASFRSSKADSAADRQRRASLYDPALLPSPGSDATAAGDTTTTTTTTTSSSDVLGTSVTSGAAAGDPYFEPMPIRYGASRDGDGDGGSGSGSDYTGQAGRYRVDSSQAPGPSASHRSTSLRALIKPSKKSSGGRSLLSLMSPSSSSSQQTAYADDASGGGGGPAIPHPAGYAAVVRQDVVDVPSRRNSLSPGGTMRRSSVSTSNAPVQARASPTLADGRMPSPYAAASPAPAAAPIKSALKRPTPVPPSPTPRHHSVSADPDAARSHAHHAHHAHHHHHHHHHPHAAPSLAYTGDGASVDRASPLMAPSPSTHGGMSGHAPPSPLPAVAASPVPPASESHCYKCAKRIQGQFVRALGKRWHLDCFRCEDCAIIIAEKFFRVKDPPGAPPGPLVLCCEMDYFRRLDLLCATCGGPLREPHVRAVGRKFHVDHFTCGQCGKVLRQHDQYFEQDDDVVCQEHYRPHMAAVAAAASGGGSPYSAATSLVV